MSDFADLYQEILLDHGRTPRNFRTIEPCDHRAEGYNPLCGDRVDLTLRVEEDRIVDAAFTGQACAICTASASMMTDAVRGQTLSDVEHMREVFMETLTNAAPADAEDVLGEAIALSGVRRFPMRVKCATLPWHTLREALQGQGRAASERDD